MWSFRRALVLVALAALSGMSACRRHEATVSGPSEMPPPPAPPATAPPPMIGCQAPASNPAEYSCGYDSPAFADQVDAAQTMATLVHPEYFDFDDLKCGNCYYVKDPDGYLAEVEKALAAFGLCSHFDGEELAVKGDNTFSEQYDILLATGHMRRAPGAYRGDCAPAVF